MKCYSAIKKNEMTSFGGKWIELETTVLNRISQTQKDQYHTIGKI
jgi:hypothetical protein